MAAIMYVMEVMFVAFAVAMPLSYATSVDASPVTSIDSNSVLVGLLDSSYTDLVELVEKASLLQSLEEEVGRHNVTILAPQNSYFEGRAQESFRRFLLEPGNIKFLQRLIEFHVVPRRFTADKWPNASFKALSSDFLQFWTQGNKLKVGLTTVVNPDAIVRNDGVVHGVEAFLVPKIVQEAFLNWKKKDINDFMAPGSQQAPGSILGQRRRMESVRHMPAGMHLSSKIWLGESVMGSAPAPSPSAGSLQEDAEDIVNGLLSALFQYKDYSEMADLLVNMTSLASELAKLVKEGYRLTILAPNNEAFNELTEEQLNAPEQTILYHILPEYQTENSLYNAVRRFSKVSYQTLRVPFKLTAREADGTVLFGEGKNRAHLYDHDIYADGLISVQGIDKLLVPPSPRDNGSVHLRGRIMSQTSDSTSQKGVCYFAFCVTILIAALCV